MRRAVIALAMLAAPAGAQAQVMMTLAQARAMPIGTLAERVLGPDVARDVIDAKIWGDSGGLVSSPGLNAIAFYRIARVTGFPALCKIDRIHADFTSSGERGSDLPHTLTKTTMHTQFALLARPGDRAPASDCARLAPLADRDAPRLFWLGDAWNEGNSDSAERAYFGVLALTRAQAAAPALRNGLRCTPDPADKSRTECANPLRTVNRFPVTRISAISVDQCEEDALRICVTATYYLDPGKSGGRTVTLAVTTDAAQADPLKPFNVIAVMVGAETWAYD